MKPICLVFGLLLCVVFVQGSTQIINKHFQNVIDSNYDAYTQENPYLPRPFMFQNVGSTWQYWDLIYQGGTQYVIRQVENKKLCLELTIDYTYDGVHPVPYLAPCSWEPEQVWNFNSVGGGYYSITSSYGTEYALDGNTPAVSNFNPSFPSPFTSPDLAQGYDWYYWQVTLPPTSCQSCCIVPATLDFSSYYENGVSRQILEFTQVPGAVVNIPLKGVTQQLLNYGAALYVTVRANSGATLSASIHGQSTPYAFPQDCGSPGADITGQFFNQDYIPTGGFAKQWNYCLSVHWANVWLGDVANNLMIKIDPISGGETAIVVDISLALKCNVYDGSISNAVTIGATSAYSSLIRSSTGRYVLEFKDGGQLNLLNPGNPGLPVLWTNLPNGPQASGVYSLSIQDKKIQVTDLNGNRNVWSAGMSKQATSLNMQDDGNLVAYPSSGGAVWKTNTNSGNGAPFVKNRRMVCPGETIVDGDHTATFTCTTDDFIGYHCYWDNHVGSYNEVDGLFIPDPNFYCLYLGTAPFSQLLRSTQAGNAGAVIPPPFTYAPCTSDSCKLDWTGNCLKYEGVPSNVNSELFCKP
eukprot:Phypoly_transcript_04689.p1 GENE.Phypoly_transcript_04689~~Phypoly_transcript_04689.p1  ORF type:complete len:580 (+),score=58.36 Phypoly_transcript_04689:372-2111(+)